MSCFRPYTFDVFTYYEYNLHNNNIIMTNHANNTNDVECKKLGIGYHFILLSILILDFNPLTQSCGQRVKTISFLKVAMLHIKLKRLKHRQKCKDFDLRPPDLWDRV